MLRALRPNLWLFLLLLFAFSGASSHAAVTVLNYWRLGENDPGAAAGATATNTTDSAGSVNLQFQGNASYASDVASAAANHTGSSLSVNFTNAAYATNAIVSTATDNFGIECWVKPTALGGGQIIAYNGVTGGGGSGGWGLIIATDNTYQALFGGAMSFGTNVATANVWTHLALVRASGISTLYINGIAVATNSSIPGTPGGRFALATTPQALGAQSFTGLIDEVRVFTFSPGQFSTSDLLLNQSPVPSVTMTAPTLLTTNTATLNGTVNPNGLPTAAWFQWGPSQYPYRYTTAITNLGNGKTALSVSQALSGLTLGLNYHYHLVASNAAGVVRSPDSKFWAPALTVNGNNPLILKHQTWIDTFGAKVLAAPDEISEGTDFSLALKADGTLAAWGANGTAEFDLPYIATNVVAISAGEAHSLALEVNQTIVGWGNNSLGEINIPANATNIVAVAAGSFFSLASRADGTVIGWGDNYYGETTIPANATNVVAIAAGGAQSLVLRADGSVIIWGDNSLHELNVPSGATNLIAIAAGYFHSLALRADGTVFAWGYNIYGQTNVPASATNVIAIAAGENHSLALRSDGTMVAWGDNSYGQLNIPASATNVIAIAAGGLASLAMRADGTVIGWGSDSEGAIDIPPGLTTLSLPVASTDNVNTNTPGSYQENYFVTNAYGIVATTSRNVLVIDSPSISNLSAALVGTNAADGRRITRFSAAVNPNGSATIVSIAYGLTAGYGAVSGTNILPGLFTPQATTIDVPLSPGFTFHWEVAATNGLDSIPGSAFSPDQLVAVPTAFLLGDANGDGIVDQSELNTVYSNYLPTSPWLLMTNLSGLGQTNVGFALSNSILSSYSVEISTNLVDWQYLGPATPRYLFTDTNAPAVARRFYRLSYP